MFRAFGLCALLALSAACTPTTTYVIGGFPENVTNARCFTGGEVFGLDLSIPNQLGRVVALTQFAQTSDGLEPICRLDVSEPEGGAFPIYSGEVYGGNAGICVSARMNDGGHYVSCANSSQVRRAMSQPLGSSGNTITLSRWSPYQTGS